MAFFIFSTCGENVYFIHSLFLPASFFIANAVFGPVFLDFNERIATTYVHVNIRDLFYKQIKVCPRFFICNATSRIANKQL